MIWFALVFAQSVLAAAVAQPSDIVLIYESTDSAAQGKENYLFTVAGDNTIYPCDANRCSLAEFTDQATINLTIYKLPEGYPRVATVVDQVTLQEYVASAVTTYTVPNVSTTPPGDGSTGRTFQELQLKADGSFELDVVSQERNTLLQEDVVETKPRSKYIWALVIGVIVLGTAGAGFWLWKRKF